MAGDGRARHGRRPDVCLILLIGAAVLRHAAASGGCCAARSHSSRRSSSSCRWACSPRRERPRRSRSAPRPSCSCPSGRRSRALPEMRRRSRARRCSRSPAASTATRTWARVGTISVLRTSARRVRRARASTFQVAHLKCPSCVNPGSPMPPFAALGDENLAKLADIPRGLQGPEGEMSRRQGARAVPPVVHHWVT